MTAPHVAARFSLHPMLPSPSGRPRSGITSTTIYADHTVARRVLDHLQTRARPGTMVLPLVIECVPARGPAATMSGLAGYRIVSRGARTTRTVTAQVAELNAIAERMGWSPQQDLLSA